MQDVISLESLWSLANIIFLALAFLLVLGFIFTLLAFATYVAVTIQDGGPAALVKDIAKHVRLAKDAVVDIKRERITRGVVENISKQAGVEAIETQEDLDRVLSFLAAEMAKKELKQQSKSRRFYRN